MRIVIVGAGALGGLVGAQLADSGENVTLIEINQARMKLLNETGLFISAGAKGERCVPIKVVSSAEEIDGADLIFVSVKSYQTEVAIRGVSSIIGPDTRVLSMQNGIGNAEKMAEIIGPERVLSGITYHSIQHTGPNRLRYRKGIKPIQIAPVDGKLTSDLEAIGEVFRKAGLDTNVVESIDHVVWQKLLHNAVVNPVSALTGLTCRELLDDEACQDFMRSCCLEIIEVMRARGVPIVDEEDPYRPVIGSQKALGKNRPSMWQDLSRGLKTEIDAINGAIVDEAQRLDMQAPLNWGLVRFMKSREHQVLRRMRRVNEVVETVKRTQLPLLTRATPRADLGGMPEGRVPLECAPKLKELMANHYADLDAAADDDDRHVVWSSGLAPVEILRALGLTPYFPENHAALIGASRQAEPYIRRALNAGFSQFASTAMASDIGAYLAGESPLVPVYDMKGPPAPEALVYNTAYAESLRPWFEFYGQRFGVSVHGLHPSTGVGELDQLDVDISVQQLSRLVSELEDRFDRKLDFDRLSEVVGYSQKAASLWAAIVALARSTPSPLTYFDMLVHLAPMVLMRGTPAAVEYYRILLAELEQRVANGTVAVPGERFRFYWEGPPIWCALRPLATLFLEHQVAVVGSSYSHVFAVDTLDPDNPIESMARTYAGIYPNLSSNLKESFLRTELERFGVDAIIYHDGRTARKHSTVREGLQQRIYATNGLPYMVVEADTHDPRLFSIDSLDRKVVEFIETTERRNGHHESPGNGLMARNSK